MATRSVVDFVSGDQVVARVYRHWDGYPDEAGADLLAFVEACRELPDSRLSDPSYLSAKFVVFLAAKFRGMDAHPLDFLGVGIVPGDCLCGAEYAYRVEGGAVSFAYVREGEAGDYRPLEVEA